jgi:uncharacterized membrane protein YqjE
MTDKASPRLFRTLKHLLANLAEVGRTRLALLANEVEEEEIRLRGIVTHAVLALACLVVSAVLLVVFLTILFWESRLLVLGAASLLFFAAALGFAWRGSLGLARGSLLFKASIAELEADVAHLRSEIQPHEPPSA